MKTDSHLKRHLINDTKALKSAATAHLILVFLSGHRRKFWPRYFKLCSVWPLNGEERISLEASADVLVSDVEQLVVGDVVCHVANALLDPLKNANINKCMNAYTIVI